MADPLARNDWIGTREDRWTDVLPQSWQSAINTSPIVNALAKYMQPRQSFDQATRQWQDSLPGNSPIDRIAEGRGTVASEYPKPFSPFAADLMEKGNALAMFLGPAAKTANLNALGRAQQMHAAGAPREQIWQQEGWFQGPDKKWRFEIDDRNMWMTPKDEAVGRVAAEQPGAVRRALDWMNGTETTMVHRDLLAAYPDAGKRIEVKLAPMGEQNHAYFDSDNISSLADVFRTKALGKEIGINTQNRTLDQRRSSGLHEIQHYVQDREGFASGASFSGHTPAERAAVRADAASNPQHPLHAAHKYNVLDDTDINAYLYLRSAGEAEARATEARRFLTPEQRRERSPWLDYDLPEAEQIVKFRP